MTLEMHPQYRRLVELAEFSHASGRDISRITEDDVVLARLYCHAFRSQVIGAFHATAIALTDISDVVPTVDNNLAVAKEVLRSLTARALDPIAHDYRALVSSFYHYDRGVHQVVSLLDSSREYPALRKVLQKFVRHIERITSSTGIVCARDDEVPDQASFVVPNLRITIVPLVYGDYHSWNTAYLSRQAPDVPRHRHSHGVEIHLGLAHVDGITLLGDECTEVKEGYAMGIRAHTPHGFINCADREHYLPFIFGSRSLGGWGIVPDVEAQPIDVRALRRVTRTGACLNRLAYLSREIDHARSLTGNARWTLMAKEVTYSPSGGGIILSIARVSEAGLTYSKDGYRIVSVVCGEGQVRIGTATQAVSVHDHFGIPAGVPALIRSTGRNPLVTLDATFVT